MQENRIQNEHETGNGNHESRIKNQEWTKQKQESQKHKRRTRKDPPTSVDLNTQGNETLYSVFWDVRRN